MSSITLISGTDFNIAGIHDYGSLNSPYKAEVTMFNKYGYIGVTLGNNSKLVKRHLSDCEDIRSLTIGSAPRNLEFRDKRWIVIHDGIELPSSDVYVVGTCITGEQLFIARSSAESKMTSDITKAWFTFVREQAVGYADKLSIITMCAYEIYSVEDIIELQHYE